jgi:hypothetical protein
LPTTPTRLSYSPQLDVFRNNNRPDSTLVPFPHPRGQISSILIKFSLSLPKPLGILLDNAINVGIYFQQPLQRLGLCNFLFVCIAKYQVHVHPCYVNPADESSNYVAELNAALVPTTMIDAGPYHFLKDTKVDSWVV